MFGLMIQNALIIYICLMLQISEIIELIENDLQKINLPENPAGLYQPLAYMLSIGGKRIRPALSLMASNLFSDQLHPFINTALAMEVFHNFTLMHDDIMDDAPMRRGKQSVHEKWNINTAILSGDVMLVKAYELICNSEIKNKNEILNRFNQTAIKVCEGQQLDIDFEKSHNVSVSSYIDMITKKTAVLLGCSLYCGALAAGAEMHDAEYLYEAGIAAGISFQIMDDLLDVYGDAGEVGKKSGGDIVQNKKTFLFVHTFAASENSDRNNLIGYYTNKFQSDEKIKAVVALFDKYKAKEQAAHVMKSYFETATEKLEQVSVAKNKKEMLTTFFNTIYNRRF